MGFDGACNRFGGSMSGMRTWLSSNGAQQKCDRSKRQRRAGALGRTWQEASTWWTT